MLQSRSVSVAVWSFLFFFLFQVQDLLRKEDGGCEIMPKSESDWHRVVPIYELRVDAEKIGAGEWPTWGVEDIKGGVD
jgi:hypothetical protein